ncbi:hypothetical protein [Niabella aquatica]
MSIKRLDKTAFKAHSLADAANHARYYKHLSWQERLKIAGYLNSVAYQFNPEYPPVMDRYTFRARALKNG